MEKIQLKFKKLDTQFNDIDLPSYATEGSAGLDIRAAIADELTLKAGTFGAVPTNLSVEIPKGYELQVRPRSGLAIKYGIGLMNAPGTIDSDFRGEIKIILFNFSKEDFVISRGDRIAQLVLAKVETAEIIQVDDLAESKRKDGGFGHTGRK